MPEWVRAAIEVMCGGPHADPVFIQRGDPMLTYQITGVPRPKVRCRHCAGEPPPDLPPLVERAPITPMVKLPTGINSLPFDYKAAQSREPGEDDD